jgi:hypothetical protein
MRTIRWLCIFFGIASLVGAAAAQSPQATPPPLGPGPLLKRAPNFSQWLISSKLGSADAPLVPDANTKFDQRTLVRKTGAIRYEITAYVDGRRTEKWCQGDFQAAVIPGEANPIVTVRGANAVGGGFTDYSKSDFPGFEWISKRNYIGVQTMEGVSCIVFHEGSKGGGDAPSTAGGNTAYIAADTRLPVLLQADDGTATLYQMEAPPSTPLAIPPNVQASFDILQARFQRAAAVPAAP